MFFKKSGKPQGRIDSLIGAGTKLIGDIEFSGGLRIDGEVEGGVRAVGDAPTTLVVSEQAVVTGGVDVAHAVINGTINGPVHASELLELQPRARIHGDISYHQVEMHQGAAVEGRLIQKHPAAKTTELKLAASNA